jgi:hypothetical protein
MEHQRTALGRSFASNLTTVQSQSLADKPSGFAWRLRRSKEAKGASALGRQESIPRIGPEQSTTHGIQFKLFRDALATNQERTMLSF